MAAAVRGGTTKSGGGTLGKPMVISETGAAGIYEWDDNTTDAKWTLKYQSEVIANDVDVAIANANLSGLTLWHFYDFKVDNCGAQWPCKKASAQAGAGAGQENNTHCVYDHPPPETFVRPPSFAVLPVLLGALRLPQPQACAACGPASLVLSLLPLFVTCKYRIVCRRRPRWRARALRTAPPSSSTGGPVGRTTRAVWTSGGGRSRRSRRRRPSTRTRSGMMATGRSADSSVPQCMDVLGTLTYSHSAS